jgi:hypothetical protein
MVSDRVYGWIEATLAFNIAMAESMVGNSARG